MYLQNITYSRKKEALYSNISHRLVSFKVTIAVAFSCIVSAGDTSITSHNQVQKTHTDTYTLTHNVAVNGGTGVAGWGWGYYKICGNNKLAK